MSKKANHLMIGVFVLGAIVIAVAGIVILSAGALFRETEDYIMYFEGDLSGLDVGAPLDFKGVEIGKVKDISIVYDHKDQSVAVPVIVEFDKSCLSEINCESNTNEEKGMQLQIKRGLRAQLKSQSMVTGKLKVSMVYDHKNPPVFRAKDSELPEMPTVPKVIDSLTRKLSQLPFEEIVVDIQSITKSLSKIVTSGKITQMMDTLEVLTKKINSLPFESIAADMQVTSKSISAMASSGNLNKIMESMNSTLAESHELMATINKESRPFKEEMMIMMEQLGEAAESIKNLGDYLERHPESLIHGKGKE